MNYRRGSSPEVVRIRCQSESASAQNRNDTNAPEVIRHPTGIQPHVLFKNTETIAGVELDIPKTDDSFQAAKGIGSGAEIIRVKSALHKGIHTFFLRIMIYKTLLETPCLSLIFSFMSCNS